MQLLRVFNNSYEEINHIKTACFYLENLLQIKLGGHSYEKVFLQRWIKCFKDLIDKGLFKPSDEVDQECLKVFYGILQDEFDEIMKASNQHQIRRIRMSKGGNGVPDVMYFLPNVHGKKNRDEIEDADLLLSCEFISEPSYYGCSNKFAQLACIIINELHIDMPKDKESAEQLYF